MFVIAVCPSFVNFPFLNWGRSKTILKSFVIAICPSPLSAPLLSYWASSLLLLSLSPTEAATLKSFPSHHFLELQKRANSANNFTIISIRLAPFSRISRILGVRMGKCHFWSKVFYSKCQQPHLNSFSEINSLNKFEIANSRRLLIKMIKAHHIWSDLY